jgi:Flp pilus assembly protein CpaB
MTATDVTIPARPDPRPPERPRRRRVTSRLSAGHVVMIVAGLMAALANLAVIRSGSETVPVLVAREDIPLGATVTADQLRTVDARLDAGVLATLVLPGDVAAGGLDGQVTATTIPAGSPVRRTDLRPAATSEPGLRRMAVPVRREAAVGGALAVDDRIDVIQVVDGIPRYVVADARVLAVPESGTGALGATGSFYVTIGVDTDTALCLSAAIEAGGLTIVLSTGQEPVATEPCLVGTTGGTTGGAVTGTDGR